MKTDSDKAVETVPKYSACFGTGVVGGYRSMMASVSFCVRPGAMAVKKMATSSVDDALGENNVPSFATSPIISGTSRNLPC